MNRSPMRTTLAFGLACGLLFVPGLHALRPLAGGVLAVRLPIWLALAGYAFLLAAWGDVRRTALLFPIAMAAVGTVLAPSHGIFLALSLGILAWIRGGLAFPGGPFRTLAAEALLTLGGAALVLAFAPRTPIQWALGLWLFFAIQSFYFVRGNRAGDSDDADGFEKARREAERILSETP